MGRLTDPLEELHLLVRSRHGVGVLRTAEEPVSGTRDRAQRLDLPLPRGVFLPRMPGCGKSLSARAVATADDLRRWPAERTVPAD